MWEEKDIFFLFSIHQVISLLNQDHIPTPPDKSAKIVGQAEWRGNNLPLISLENCLELPAAETVKDQRIVAIREVYRDKDNELKDLYALCQLNAAIRKLQLPFDSRPITVPGCIENPSLLKGVYEMEKCILLMVNLRSILGISTLSNSKVTVN
jgi:chemotaxis signal transduction protein